MRRFGLLGKSLDHSFSPVFFQKYFARHHIVDAVYTAFPIADHTLVESFLRTAPKELKGLNVTFPYKETVVSLVRSLDPIASVIGAVNVLKRTPDGGWVGFNTDGPALLDTLKSWLGSDIPERALILGAGGASKAAAWALKSLSISYELVSRNPAASTLAYHHLSKELLDETRLIIHTTPVGTYPQVDQMVPFPTHWLESKHRLYDLNYNPPITRIMQKAALHGALVKNGLEMLENQAMRSWLLWNSQVSSL